jgi:hypothetical protein
MQFMELALRSALYGEPNYLPWKFYGEWDGLYTIVGAERKLVKQVVIDCLQDCGVPYGQGRKITGVDSMYNTWLISRYCGIYTARRASYDWELVVAKTLDEFLEKLRDAVAG